MLTFSKEVVLPLGHIKVVRLIIHDDFRLRRSSAAQSFFFDLEHKADNEMRLIDLFSREEFKHQHFGMGKLATKNEYLEHLEAESISYPPAFLI